MILVSVRVLCIEFSLSYEWSKASVSWVTIWMSAFKQVKKNIKTHINKIPFNWNSKNRQNKILKFYSNLIQCLIGYK